MKVQVESFHLNGHIIEFRPQTPKLELPYKIPSSTLAVKGLTLNMDKFITELAEILDTAITYIMAAVLLTTLV